MNPSEFAVTSLQQSMLRSARMTASPGLNLEQIIVHFPGAVDTGLLRRAWRVLGTRHEALRIRYRWPAGGVPVQSVAESVDPPWGEVDATGDDAAAFTRRFEQFLDADRRGGFDIEGASPSRFQVFARPDRGTTLVWSFPHALLDGRSMGLVLEELMQVHQELRVGRIPEAEPRPGAAGYGTWLAGQRWEAGADWWRGRFESFQSPPRFALGSGALDRGGTGETREIRVAWERDLTGRMQALAAAEGFTLNTLLQGAFGLVLSRYLGGNDVAFWVVRAGRHWGGKAHGRDIGFFMNTLPVRCHFEPGTTVGDWLRALREQHTAIRPVEHMPADEVRRVLAGFAGTAADEVGFRYEREGVGGSVARVVPGCEGVRVEIRERAGMPLFLGVEGETDLALTLEYDPVRCTSPVAERLLGHLRCVCESMVMGPAEEILRMHLPVLPGECRQPPNLPGWEGGGIPDSVLALVDDVAVRQPESTAVEDDRGRVTYAAMVEYSHRLAALLVARGVGRDEIVALSTERRPYGVGALLGVFRAGAAVLQIDPTLPKDRQRFMIEDAGVRTLIADAATAPALADLGLATVLIDDTPPAMGSALESGAGPGPKDASYVIYTSGTTGKPKGVVNTHRGLANEARAAAHLFQLGPADRMLHMANLSFDAAFEEIFATLVSGGALVCRPPEALDSLALFHRAVEDRRITVLDLTTSFWAQWVSWMDREKRPLPAALRVLVVGGEKTQTSTYAIWQQLSQGRVRWVNTYGPTEAAIVATGYVTPDGPVAGQVEVPIGRPLPNVYVRLLDEHRREVPLGVAGELYIGGVGVARGYLNRPDLTRRAFLDDPLSAEPGAKLYRTGDLARVREDGEIEYLGRADNQVKIRGFRIEVDEVENAVSGHPQVAEGVVVPVMEGGRVAALAAYVVPRNRDLTAALLKEDLAARLPKYAIPGHVILLERLPLTANGKVDRRALPKPEAQVEELTGGPPVGPIEESLATVFARALRRDRVGAEENFQEAGGDSFMVMELIELAARAGFLFHPETVIRHPTVRGLAAHLAAAGTASDAARSEVIPWSPISVLRESPGAPRLLLAHSTPGDVLGYGNLVHALGSGVAVYGFSSLGLNDPGRAHATIEDMAAYYVDHLLRMFPTGPYHLAGWCYGGTVAFEMAGLLRARGLKVGVVALIDSYAHVPPGALGTWRWNLRRLSSLLRLGPARIARYAASKVFPGPAQQPLDEPAGRSGTVQEVANRNHVRGRNLEAILRYRGLGYPGPIHVYLSSEVGDAKIFDPQGGWPIFTDEGQYHIVQANHRDVLKPPAVEQIAAHLRSLLFLPGEDARPH